MAVFDLIVITQLFALINPLSSFPMLLSVYYKKVSYGKNINVTKIAMSSVGVAFLIAVSIVFLGPLLFTFFGISLDSFRIAGGIVLLLLGLDTIRPKKEEEMDSGQVENLISIIATPMLTGPATISFITLKAFELGRFSLLTNLIISFMAVGIVFWSFSRVIGKVNTKVISILSRVMGLFLTAVSIEMITKGLEGILKGGL